MKSILMSIQPYWGFLIIAKGKGWDLEKYGNVSAFMQYRPDLLSKACLTNEELALYLGIKDGYINDGCGLHISDLKIYDKPKALSEFRHFVKCNACKSGYEAAACLYDEKCLVPARLTRPPQSWCYVEEL